MSPHALARIKRVETAQAKAAGGVVVVLTGADLEADKLGALVPVMPEDMGGPKGFHPPDRTDNDNQERRRPPDGEKNKADQRHREISRAS
jgi:CO/xanthine dehydrogenase Mo-binding subunit